MSKIIWHDLSLPAINLWSLPMSYNGVTGDALVTRVGSKEQQQKYADNYDRVFKKWIKHDGSIECPIDNNQMVEVETWTPHNVTAKASDLHWQSVKFYRVISV